MRLRFVIAGLYPRRREVRKAKHRHMHDMYVEPALPSSMRAQMDMARTCIRTPWAHLHGHIVEPIKEMSLISRGAPALVNHRGFLAGSGDMQGSLSSLLDLSHHALIRHSSKLYRES